MEARSRETNFGSHDAYSLGIEEELLLVGADHELLDHGAEVLDRAAPDRGALAGELFAAMVEGKSPICSTVADAAGALREVRRELLRSDARIIGAGVHPNAAAGSADVHDSPRYALIAQSLQGVLRTPLCGQHVHVGLPDTEAAIRAYNGIRTHVPLLNALAANSPFWFGEDSGLASSRTVIFRSYPRAAMAPEFADFAEFERVTQQVCRAAGLEDYTHIWWDVRVHPGLGTIEVRAADAQSNMQRVGALAAFVHCLARIEAERDQDDIPAREALAESAFQATRHGLDAELLDRNAELVPARTLAARTLELAGEVAGELGCDRELAHVELILEQGSGADLQRRVHAARGMPGLLAHLADETARLG